MSVSWSVFPIIPEALEWLQEFDIPIPEGDSRWATLDDLLVAIEPLNQIVHRKDYNTEEDFPSIALIVGKLDNGVFAQIHGIIYPERFGFWFEGSGNQGRTMLTILKNLSSMCGAQVIFSGTGENPQPLIISPDIDIEQALVTWWLRKS